MGTDEAPAASNPGSTAEGARMISEEAVSRFLHAAPTVVCSDDVLSRLRATIAGEMKFRHASRVEPDANLSDLKAESPLWQHHDVLDD